MDLTILVAAGRPIGPSDIRILARAAHTEIEHTDGYEACRTLGQKALHAIAENAPDKADRIYAEVVDNATKGLSAHNATECQERALQVLSRGVTGPLSVALATLGVDSLPKCDNYNDARALGRGILEGVSKNSDEIPVMLLSNAAVAASAAAAQGVSSVHALTSAFSQLSYGLRHPLERTLAEYGKSAIGVADNRDARAIGQAVLKSVFDNSERTEVQFIANNALAVSGACRNNGEAISVEKRAFKDIRKS